MKRFGIGFGVAATVAMVTAACSSDNTGTTTTGGSAGTPAAGTGGVASAGGGAGGAGGSTAGAAGTAAGVSGGGSGGGGGVGGAAGLGGVGGLGGAGGVGGAACDTKPGKAIKFVGGNNNVIDSVAGDLGNDGPQGDDPRTVELWAKYLGANSWVAERSVLELGVPPAQDDGNNVFGIDMSDRSAADTGVFGPYTHGVSDNNGTGAPPQYKAAPDVGWLHLSWSYDPTNQDMTKRLVFTVNGTVLPTEFNKSAYDKTQDKLVLNTGYVLLGASQHFGHVGWDGVMDEVRIWKVYRTPQQIKDNMNVIVKPDSPGLVAYYQFNEGDAANINDSTKKASHKLAACTAAQGACPEANGAPPTFVDSDIPGPFTCAP